MSRKRNHSRFSNLLTPQTFLSSLSKLNVVPQSTSISSSSTSSRRSVDGDRVEEGIKIVCTNEAIELLRQFHGQFVSMVSSELASGDRSKGKKRNVKEKKRKLKHSIKEEETSSTEGEVRSILPQHVLDALDKLEFQNIIQDIRLIMNDNDKSTSTGDSKDSKNTSPSSSKKRSIKKAFKNVSMTAELLAEQEKLFAMSAAKIKDVINR